LTFNRIHVIITQKIKLLQKLRRSEILVADDQMRGIKIKAVPHGDV
jgi:hypothetical protein